MNQPAPRDGHPVWTVYNKLQSARVNVKYYGRRLQRFEGISFSIDLLLLATAPSSAIAGLWFWNTEYGQDVWQWMGALAALAAVTKPLLGLTKRIKDYENLLSGYRMLEYDLMEIRSSIQHKQKYDQALQSEFKRVTQREKVLIARNPESRESRRTKLKCEIEVLRDLQSNPFFIPN